MGFGWACASTRSRRVLCCCGRQGSGRSARSRGLAVAYAASLHINRLNVLFMGCGWRHNVVVWPYVRISLFISVRPVTATSTMKSYIMYFNFLMKARGLNIKTEWIQLNCIFLFPLEDFLLIVLLLFIFILNLHPSQPVRAMPSAVCQPTQPTHTVPGKV